jgi:hypothetical protein
MKALHAVALALCAVAPYVWIGAAVALLLQHGGAPTRWALDDWTLVAALVLVPIALAAALLRVPARHRRTERAL